MTETKLVSKSRNQMHLEEIQSWVYTDTKTEEWNGINKNQHNSFNRIWKGSRKYIQNSDWLRKSICRGENQRAELGQR